MKKRSKCICIPEDTLVQCCNTTKENSSSTLPLLYLLVYKRDTAYILASAPSDLQYIATTILVFPFIKEKIQKRDY